MKRRIERLEQRAPQGQEWTPIPYLIRTGPDAYQDAQGRRWSGQDLAERHAAAGGQRVTHIIENRAESEEQLSNE